MALLSLRHLSDAADVDSVHTEPGALRPRDGHRRHWLDLPLHHEVPGDGVELRRNTDAAVVRILSAELVAALPPRNRIDTSYHSIIRRHAAGHTKRRIFCLAFQIGS